MLWPTLYDYAMAHRCPTCKRLPGIECLAPKKAKRQRELGLESHCRLHSSRQHLGSQHYLKDLGDAPPIEERQPGKRYDTLSH